MAPKNKFIGVRVDQQQQLKLILLSVQAGEPGNMSAGLRYLIDRTKVSGSVNTEEVPAQQVSQTNSDAGSVRQDKTASIRR